MIRIFYKGYMLIIEYAIKSPERGRISLNL